MITQASPQTIIDTNVGRYEITIFLRKVPIPFSFPNCSMLYITVSPIEITREISESNDEINVSRGRKYRQQMIIGKIKTMLAPLTILWFTRYAEIVSENISTYGRYAPSPFFTRAVNAETTSKRIVIAS